MGIDQERERERDKDRERDKERDEERERERQKERERERERGRIVQNCYFYFKRNDGCLAPFSSILYLNIVHLFNANAN